MAKKITGHKICKSQCWPRKDSPYAFVKEIISEGKSKEEAKKAIQEFEESHSYLLICEYGRATPMAIDEIYEAEQNGGFVAFVKKLQEEVPTFFMQ